MTTQFLVFARALEVANHGIKCEGCNGFVNAPKRGELVEGSEPDPTEEARLRQGGYSSLKELKDELRQLDERISEVSGQVAKVLDIAQNLQKKYEQSEYRHAHDEESRKRSEWLLFKTGLVMFSFLGVFTGLMIAYVMKAYESLSIPPFTWWFLSIAILAAYALIAVMMVKIERPKNL